MSDDPEQWHVWVDEYKRRCRWSDRVTVLGCDHCKRCYRICVDGIMDRSRTGERVTREILFEDLDAVLKMVREDTSSP